MQSIKIRKVLSMDLSKKARQIRKTIVEMIYRANFGHVGGALSVTDIIVDLYYKQMNISPENITSPDRDRFILSKGHAVEALYAVLADKNFIPREDLLTYSQFGSNYMCHPTNKICGIEMNTGSLGHGLGVGIGMALAGKMDNKNYRVYVVLGDGELAEGSVWEAAMAASHYKLDNLTAFVDRNRLQMTGATESVMALDDLAARWNSFGWNVLSIDGNDIGAIDAAISLAKKTSDKPTAIIANTVKGKGVSFMENRAEWHHKVPNAEQFAKAMEELS